MGTCVQTVGVLKRHRYKYPLHSSLNHFYSLSPKIEQELEFSRTLLITFFLSIRLSEPETLQLQFLLIDRQIPHLQKVIFFGFVLFSPS